MTVLGQAPGNAEARAFAGALAAFVAPGRTLHNQQRRVCCAEGPVCVCVCVCVCVYVCVCECVCV
jgi:hypothetical protein